MISDWLSKVISVCLDFTLVELYNSCNVLYPLRQLNFLTNQKPAKQEIIGRRGLRAFSLGCHGVVCFPARAIGGIFSHACHQLHLFPRLILMFSHAWHRSYVFPRLVLVVCFPALGTTCTLSPTWEWDEWDRFCVFPRLALVVCFCFKLTFWFVHCVNCVCYVRSDSIKWVLFYDSGV